MPGESLLVKICSLPNGMQLKRYCISIPSFSPFTVVESSLANILCKVALALMFGLYFIACRDSANSGKGGKSYVFLSRRIL